MSSITIHNIDPKLNQKLRFFAQKKNQSLNKAVKFILNKEFGLIKEEKEANYKEDFLDLFGVWSNQDYDEFQKKMKDFEKVNLKEW